ncbi:MAG: protein kinase [Alphaproteobacteria bacterium]|nr:protein kinase [Alphaproteobacteria bacterium]MCB9690794.1 protein kinase [Alphaproteobacteria bacterium]
MAKKPRTIPLGPFELVARIGVGGGGEVWRGHHVDQGVAVAVKVMSTERASDERYHAAFEHEVRAVAGLEHPGIVTVLDYGRIDSGAAEASRNRLVAGSPYLAMELAEQGSLRSAKLPETFEDLRNRLLWLLDILAHAHARGVIHRDLKPGNVLVFAEPAVRGDADGASCLRLTDFGLAHPMDRADPSGRGTAGTPAYMAPEQFRGRWRDFGPPTDLYALGCLAWTLASGRPPFAAREVSALMHAHLTEPIAPIAPIFPVPEGFDGWLRGLLRKNPNRRFQRAADAASALVALGAAPLGRAKAVSAIQESPTWSPPIRAHDHTATDDALSATYTATNTRTEMTEATRDEGEVDEEEVPIDSEEVDEPDIPRPLPPLPRMWRASLPQRPSMRLIGAGLRLYGMRPVPLVARNGERDAMWAALARVRKGAGVQVVTLSGPAGTGKSRLAEWLGVQADSVGSALVARATHSPSGAAGDGLTAMIARLTRSFGLEREQMSARLSRWHRDRRAPDATRTILEFLAPRAENVIGSAFERHAIVLDALLAEARSQVDDGVRPILLWLDDVQWGQDALAFVQWLLERPDRGRLPVLVLMTVQEEALHARKLESQRLEAIARSDRTTGLRVGPLSDEERVILVQELLRLEGDLARQVEARTQGIPLFAVQLVGDWVQRGVLEVGETGFVLRKGERAVIPDGIHELWDGRVERLLAAFPSVSREVLELAALLGTEVDGVEWSAACRVAGIEHTEAVVPALVSQRLAHHTENGWAFAHGMLRESLERSAAEAGRLQTLHRTCATTLQIRREASGRRGLAERIARHLILGGAPEKALEPLLDAAAERRTLSDYGGAIALLDRRQRVLDDLAVADDDPRRGRGWVARADVLVCMGRLAEAEVVANKVVRVGRRRGWERLMAPALRLAAVAVGKRGQFKAAERRLSRAIDAARFGNEELEAARCTLFLGDVARLQGALEDSAGHCRGALARFRALDDLRGQGEALTGLAGVYLAMGQLDQAERYALAAIEKFDAVGARFGIASTRNLLGDVFRSGGRLEAASAEYQAAEEGLLALGSPEVQVPALNLALLDLERARWASGRKRLEAVLVAMEDTKRRGFVGLVQVGLAWACAGAGAWALSRQHLEAGRACLVETGLFDTDIALAAERAGKLAGDANERSLQRDLADLAGSQWRGLGKPERARALDTELM